MGNSGGPKYIPDARMDELGYSLECSFGIRVGLGFRSGAGVSGRVLGLGSWA